MIYMAYCIYLELKNLTGTELATDILDDIIAQADNEINSTLLASGISPPGANNMLKAASLKLSMIGVMTRHRMDGTQPGSLSLGDITLSDDINGAIAQLRSEARILINNYIVSNNASTRRAERVYKVNG